MTTWGWPFKYGHTQWRFRNRWCRSPDPEASHESQYRDSTQNTAVTSYLYLKLADFSSICPLFDVYSRYEKKLGGADNLSSSDLCLKPGQTRPLHLQKKELHVARGNLPRWSRLLFASWRTRVDFSDEDFPDVTTGLFHSLAFAQSNKAQSCTIRERISHTSIGKPLWTSKIDIWSKSRQTKLSKKFAAAIKGKTGNDESFFLFKYGHSHWCFS